VVAVDPVFNLLDPSVTDLKMFVVPGDVVLFETAAGSFTDRTTWSDLLHFETGPNSSIATVFPDLENGVIGLPLGFSLSANAVGILESPTDPSTQYVAGANVYNISSDCSGPGCEVFEPNEGVPEPASAGLLGLGFVAVLMLRRSSARP